MSTDSDADLEPLREQIKELQLQVIRLAEQLTSLLQERINTIAS